MKNTWAKNKATGVMDADITSTNTLDESTHERYLTDDRFETHESGEPVFVADGDGYRRRIDAEIRAGAKYRAWFNAKIDAQLASLDIKRIRQSAEINDDDTSAQEKQAAKAVLKDLNAQAKALRNQRI